MDNGTVVWGCSDDLIEVSGAVRGEVNGSAGTITMSDGTVLKVKYGKPHDGSLWQITLMVKGPLFDWIENNYVERDHYKVIDGKKERDRGAYSDVAHFKTGITSASHRGKVFTRAEKGQ